MRYPIREGISATESYRSATRNGIWPEDDEDATGLRLRRPELVHLSIERTLAGRIPILVAGDRGDFEDLVRAFSARNEPVDIPASMGACLVRGLNNWDRVRSYQEVWEKENPTGDWADGFQELVPRKELYEDRFIILSTGPYSGVAAPEADFADEAEWLTLSLSIRREHEATHYFTLRAAGAMRNNLVDELIADYVGLVRTFGRYREELALRFLGLEDYPRYREGARLQNYRGKPRLSDGAFEVAKGLAHDAIRNFARLDASCEPFMRSGDGLARLVLSLMTLGLEELASADLVATILPSIPDPGPPDTLFLDVGCDRAGIDQVIEEFAGFSERLSVPKKVVSDLFLVLDEVLSNKLKYAWEDRGLHRFLVEIRLRNGELELFFEDDGKPFDSVSSRDPDVSQPLPQKPIGGLGVYLVKKLTDGQRYERSSGTNRLWLTKRI
jgi:anti-sigma regulatory factor (Ser/Thr protein kinase)